MKGSQQNSVYGLRQIIDQTPQGSSFFRNITETYGFSTTKLLKSWCSRRYQLTEGNTQRRLCVKNKKISLTYLELPSSVNIKKVKQWSDHNKI